MRLNTLKKSNVTFSPHEAQLLVCVCVCVSLNLELYEARIENICYLWKFTSGFYFLPYKLQACHPA